MSNLTAAQIAQYRKDGFLLIKAFFSPDEVQAMKRGVAATSEGVTELFAVPELTHLWRHPKIVQTAKDLLGDATFFGEATTLRSRMRAGEHTAGRHLHHDAKGTEEHLFSRVHTPPADPFPVIRFAIYLDDFKDHSGGLKVVPGSHALDSSHFVQDQFSYFDVPSQPGDLVVFCQKILHSPYALRLRERPEKALSPDEEDALSLSGEDVFLPPPAGRDVIFIDYAGTGPLADIYIKSRAVHPMNQKTSLVAALDRAQLEEHARAQGIGLRLDFGLVEAADGILRHRAGSRLTPEAMPYFKAFRRLARYSVGTTPHFPLFEPTEDESVQATSALVSQVAANIATYRVSVRTKRADPHMESHGTSSEAPMA